MKHLYASLTGLAMLGLTSSFAMAGMDDMVGKWSWNGFTIDCTKGGDHGMSCKVAAGPKNVGMEMVQSAFAEKDGGFAAKIKHPASGETYNAKMTMSSKDAWKMDGCTDGGACASGEFTRVK